MLLGQAMWRLLLVLVVLRTASNVDGGRHTFLEDLDSGCFSALQ